MHAPYNFDFASFSSTLLILSAIVCVLSVLVPKRRLDDTWAPICGIGVDPVDPIPNDPAGRPTTEGSPSDFGF